MFWSRLTFAAALVFVATSSDKKLRAYDQDNGKVIWETSLPAASEGVPAVYEVDGREYLALCVAGGSGMMAGRGGPAAGPGSYMVFALPKK